MRSREERPERFTPLEPLGMVSPAVMPVKVAAIVTLSAGRNHVKKKCMAGVPSCIPITGVWNGTTDIGFEACNCTLQKVRFLGNMPPHVIIVPGQIIGGLVDHGDQFSSRFPGTARTLQSDVQLTETRGTGDRMIEREGVHVRAVSTYPSRPTFTRQLCKSYG